jgi:hypothetical protein
LKGRIVFFSKCFSNRFFDKNFKTNRKLDLEKGGFKVSRRYKLVKTMAIRRKNHDVDVGIVL